MTLILSSCFTGVAIGIVTAIQRGVVQGVKAAALSSLLVGVLMAMFIIPVQLFATRKLTREECKSEQIREFMMKGSLPAVFDLLHKALSELAFIRNIKMNVESKSIAARTRISLASFGEVITIETKPAEEGKVLVKICSRPAVGFTAADYGKNARNLRAILTKISSLGVEVIPLMQLTETRQ